MNTLRQRTLLLKYAGSLNISMQISYTNHSKKLESYDLESFQIIALYQLKTRNLEVNGKEKKSIFLNSGCRLPRNSDFVVKHTMGYKLTSNIEYYSIYNIFEL